MPWDGDISHTKLSDGRVVLRGSHEAAVDWYGEELVNAVLGGAHQANGIDMPPTDIGDEPSGLTHNEIAEHVTRAFNDGYNAGIAAEREKRNKRRRKGRTTRQAWQTTNDHGER